ncbi:amino acid transporter AVT1I-like [Neltuma alba]|uniref:amino acid transporter AVT1I-like n=1 Tax=Neltuma alba TaxID=207710 RepID=UPI0010A4FDD6|nr:amino acid transporter AVT1I-like [Prosopis alba]
MEIENQCEDHHSEQSRRGTTFFKTCFNGLNALAGIGVLSMPYAFSQGGWLSLILLLLVAVLCWYTGLLLHRCMDGHPHIKSYPDIGEEAFGYKGRFIVSIFIYLELYLVATGVLILEGDNMDKLFPNMGFKVCGLKIAGKQGFVILTAVVILPTTWLKSLGILAYASVGGVLASINLVGCIMWVGAFDGPGFHERGKMVNWGGLTTSTSLFTFCYCGHAVFPTLRSSMKHTSQFPKVLLVCFILSTITYGLMAIIGYMIFGEYLKSQVTLNLPAREISTKIAIYTTLVNPLTKYAILISPIANAIESKMPFHKKSRPISIIIRTSILTSTVVVALFIPFFGYLMAFTGAFLGITGSLLLPSLCYLKINKAAQRFGFELIIIIGILLIGPFIAMMGTYNSVRQIVNHLHKP